MPATTRSWGEGPPSPPAAGKNQSGSHPELSLLASRTSAGTVSFSGSPSSLWYLPQPRKPHCLPWGGLGGQADPGPPPFTSRDALDELLTSLSLVLLICAEAGSVPAQPPRQAIPNVTAPHTLKFGAEVSPFCLAWACCPLAATRRHCPPLPGHGAGPRLRWWLRRRWGQGWSYARQDRSQV